jgi:prepilin-type N-terminal cleavage/methylation domain-containing protein
MGSLAGYWVPRLRAASGHVHESSGFTMIEVLVAMAVLLVGTLGTFLLVGTANGNLSQTKARDGATNLARELLENARETAYAEVGHSSWFTSTLRDIPGGSGQVTSPASNSVRTNVTRRNITYTTTVGWCSVDDSGDGSGPHVSSTAWCAGSGVAGTADSQAEDFKRVSVAVSWAYKGVTQPTLTQTATFSFTGSVVGPTVTNLTLVSPSGLDVNAPVITSNPSGGTVTFLASTLGSATEAADMTFTVNGVEQTGVIRNGDGTWNVDWNVTTLADGIYTIGAIAVDALGTHGRTRTLQVKLARATATPPQNASGGYNSVYVSGVKTLVVELDWDASPEGSVTGYDVRNGSTVECSASLATNCIDFSPASSGSTTYTIRTNYTDGAGQPRFVSTDYTVSPPAPLAPTLYSLTAGTANSSLQCGLGAAAPMRDLSAAYAGGADATDTVPLLLGCLPTLPSGVTLGAGTVTFDVWYTNTDTQACTPGGGLLLVPANVTLAGTSPTFPGNTSTVSKLTYSANVPATSLSAGDQLVWQLNGRGVAGACGLLTIYYNSTAHQTTVSLPTLTSSAVTSQPGVPTGLTVTDNGDGTRTLRWTAPTSSSPAVDFYRIYRDGQNYTDRIDTVGNTQTCPSSSQICWTDTASGGVSHSYRVTSASVNLTESDFTGAMSG